MRHCRTFRASNHRRCLRQPRRLHRHNPRHLSRRHRLRVHRSRSFQHLRQRCPPPPRRRTPRRGRLLEELFSKVTHAYHVPVQRPKRLPCARMSFSSTPHWQTQLSTLCWKLSSTPMRMRSPQEGILRDGEEVSPIDYFDCHPLDGYRRLTFMMLDEDVVALSPSTTYRVLSKAGRLDRWNGKPSKKGTGFVQPLRPHQHWHTDISYLNLGGTFYYLCSFLDGASRAVVHWEIRESMTEADVECILERAKELYPDARPRIISDNGPQYIAKDFKTFIRISGMTHVRTAPYYPQSNGKIERWHKTIKSDALRPASPKSLEEARRLMERFVEYYNGVRLHSAIGYIAPLDFMAGKAPEI